METLLLNPNTPAPNSDAQQMSSSIPEECDGEFSPIFNEAVTSLGSDEDAQDISDETEENSIFDIAANLTVTNTDEIRTAVLSGEAVAESNDFATIEQVVFSLTETVISSEASGQSQTFNSIATFTDEPQIIQAQETSLPVAQPGTNELTTSTKVENILLQQIQQILDQNSNNGTIVITGTRETLSDDQSEIATLQNQTSPLIGELEDSGIQTRQIGIPADSTEEISTATHKSAKFEGTRQDVSEQFLNAKMDKSANDNGEQFQQNSGEKKGQEQQEQTSLQATNQASGATSTDAKPMESTFTQQLGLNTPTNTQTSSVEGKLAPGADLPVPEREIVNNLIQRFNVNPRLQTSKLTMQLHPAELGALKIDILVNNDSIKANIVAQSQQVLETLEKHMPRLKTILENQGFSVDAFAITLEGDSTNKGELFQEQFQSQQQSDFTFSNGSSSKTDSFEALLNAQDEPETTVTDESGVNVTA